MENGDPPGVLHEIMDELSSRAGIKQRPIFHPWNRSLLSVTVKPNKMLFPLGRTPERENKVTWVVQLLQISIGFVSLSKPINTLDEARKLRITVYPNSSMSSFLKSNGLARLDLDTAPISANKLAFGRVDAWYAPLPEALWTWKLQGRHQPLSIGEPIEQTQVWLAASKSFPQEIIQRYQKAMMELKKNGRHAQIIGKYFPGNSTNFLPYLKKSDQP